MTLGSSDTTNDIERALQQSGASFLEELSREVEAALTSIVDDADELRDAPSETERIGTEIHHQGAQLRGVFRSLNQLARLEQDELDLDSDSADAVRMGEQLLASYEPFARDRGTQLDLEAPDTSLQITTYPDVLRRALTHLLSEAIASTAAQEIVLRLATRDQTVAFHFESNGEADPPDDGPDDTDEDTQHASNGHSSAAGTELRLSLSRALAHHVDGSIEVDSPSDPGCVFTLRAPRHIASPESSSASNPDQEAEEEDEEAKNGRLLVLEDNEVTRKLLQRMLEEEYEVDMFARPDEAIQSVQENTYDTLILDINLGERRTGVEVLHEVRMMDEYSSIPAVACTAYALSGHGEQFLQVGFNEVITKPVTKRNLFDAIEHVQETPSAPETEGVGEVATGVELPPVSTTLLEVTDLISEDGESHDIETLTDVLEKDQVVSFWLLQQVNSAYYSLNESVETVERAVRYLGFRPVCNLVLTKVMARDFGNKEEPGAQMVQRHIMKTSSMASSLALSLAERFEIDAPKVAYTAGLLAQLGRLSLLSSEGDTYVHLWFDGQEHTAETFRGPPTRGQEILHCKTNYLEKGVAVGRACQLSNDLLAVLSGHPHPLVAESWTQPLVALVALGLDVASFVFDPGKDSWGGEEALIEMLQDSDVVHFLAEEGPLSLEELIYAVVDATKEGEEFTDSVLSDS